jgi:hypothetical protein
LFSSPKISCGPIQFNGTLGWTIHISKAKAALFFAGRIVLPECKAVCARYLTFISTFGISGKQW